MPSYRMVYGTTSRSSARLTSTSTARPAGPSGFRRHDAILRLHDEHMRSLQVLDEAAGSGKPRGKRVPR
jgi:hypothetical protein